MRITLSDHFTYQKLLRFTMPSIVMMIVTSVYSIVDGFFVSNCVGKNAFAALNLIFPVLMALFGTAAFCRKMHVTMPGGLSLKTGAFLAVDGTLIAIFAVKYTAAENVDWALHALKRSRITPVLAVRDGSITPALLKRKFGTDARAVYPTISTRLALSEKDGEHPYALLYREGLMPYAEIAVGSKRLVHAVRVATVLSLGSSAVSALLAFYLTFVGAYSALTPVSMLLYLLLWALAALIEGFWADRY